MYSLISGFQKKDKQPTVYNPSEARTLFQKQMEADVEIHNYWAELLENDRREEGVII